MEIERYNIMWSYMLVALRRVSESKNENVGLSKKVIRRLVKPDEDYHIVAKQLADELSKEEGYWRIYRSVNRRDLNKAVKSLQIELINRGDEIADRVDSVWKSIIMKPENKAERLFLIDIDTKDTSIVTNIINLLCDKNVSIEEDNETPNGYHLITKPFNPQLLKDFDDVEIKKDALLYLNSVNYSCEK